MRVQVALTNGSAQGLDWERDASYRLGERSARARSFESDCRLMEIGN